MSQKQIIAAAWQFAHSNKSLLPFGVIPAFFTTLGGVGYITYQFMVFRSSPWFGDHAQEIGQLVHRIARFIIGHDWLLWLTVISLVTVAVGYLLLPALCDGAIIGLTAAAQRGKIASSSDGLAFGFANYLRMFEYGLIVATFSFLEVFTFFSLGIRHFGPSTGLFLIAGFVLVISMIFYLLFIYTPQLIVLEKHGVEAGLMESSKLVMLNLTHTFSMAILMLLVGLRVIINIFLLFLVPTLVIFTAGFFATKVALALGIALGALVGFLVLMLAAYLAGLLNIFTTAAWTMTFLSLERERLDELLSK